MSEFDASSTYRTVLRGASGKGLGRGLFPTTHNNSQYWQRRENWLMVAVVAWEVPRGVVYLDEKGYFGSSPRGWTTGQATSMAARMMSKMAILPDITGRHRKVMRAEWEALLARMKAVVGKRRKTRIPQKIDDRRPRHGAMVLEQRELFILD